MAKVERQCGGFNLLGSDEISTRVAEAVFTGLKDTEYRVRLAVGDLLEAQSQREGRAVWLRMKDFLLNDIEDHRVRIVAADDNNAAHRDGHRPAALGHHDTEGWSSLETSMRAVQKIVLGCGQQFRGEGGSLDKELLDTLRLSSAHLNRFVREYSFLALADLITVAGRQGLEADGWAEFKDMVSWVTRGLKDNWSQVRYASCIAARAVVTKVDTFTDLSIRDRLTTLPNFASMAVAVYLNRHYVAEGVRMHAQGTWRLLVGPQGGSWILVENMPLVLDVLTEAMNAPNHAVREASCHCVREIGSRVLPAVVETSKAEDCEATMRRLVGLLNEATQDESWPVRDTAAQAIGELYSTASLQAKTGSPNKSSGSRCFDTTKHGEEAEGALSTAVESFAATLENLMQDNIPSLRRDAAAALAELAENQPSRVDLFAILRRHLEAAHEQSPNSESFSHYTPSGPFSVPAKKVSHEDYVPPDEVSNQTMYSCGSLAPKTHLGHLKKKSPGGGCMNCSSGDEDRYAVAWERSDGAVDLLASACLLRSDPSDLLDAFMPTLEGIFKLSHFKHNVNLKRTICERFMEVIRARPEIRPRLGGIREQCLELLQDSASNEENLRTARLCFEDFVRVAAVPAS
ncbi:hypothetical protein FOZ62_027359 [Perkinsus olseni]|uniref:Uncharacterized protein n=1 Tax=Perkinsus olseni TaxID=32597 RepID=A0A7J6S4J6_PEROL|nr:hypothetical protein FOZ62_027359 [Perkinsus olseni]